MRPTFIKTLVEEAEKNDKIWLLVADLGFGLVHPFQEKFPDRFINVGVAEQNMIGIATGLALEGKMVFCYSIANFPTMRCLEQIRNDVCYHNVNVVIVAGSTGVTYGELGSSHHATEDIAIMRALPNMKVFTPSDIDETAFLTRMLACGSGPCYMRLGKAPIHLVHGVAVKRKPVPKCVGTLIAMGSMVPCVLEAAARLMAEGINVSVLSMVSIKPLDVEAVIGASKVHCFIVTVEEHSIIGGLGSAVAEVIADYSLPVKFRRLGIKDTFLTEVGTQEQLLASQGLTVEGIVQTVHEFAWMVNGGRR